MGMNQCPNCDEYTRDDLLYCEFDERRICETCRDDLENANMMDEEAESEAAEAYANIEELRRREEEFWNQENIWETVDVET